ncbi:Enolase, partial [Pseudoloma neurophilia]
MTKNIISKIKRIKFDKIYSSRGLPTIKCTVFTGENKQFEASCPSGASTGSKEAAVVTNGQLLKEQNTEENEIIRKYNDKDVELVIKQAEEALIPEILKYNCSNIYEFDQLIKKIDGTENYSKYGANIVLPLSICMARLIADQKNLPLYEYLEKEYDFIERTETFTNLQDAIANTSQNIVEKNFPSPNFNILNGGAHSGNEMPFQEIMVNFSGNYDEALRKATIFYNHLKKVISTTYGSIYTGYGDEGGYMPPIKTLDEAIDLIRKTNLDLKFKDLRIAVDSAANDFYSNQKYNFNVSETETGQIHAVSYNGEEMVQFYLDILEKYPEIYLLEDPFAEEDIESWKSLTASLKETKKLILGDDLVVTNPKIIQNAISDGWCNSVLIKPNQIGCVSDTLTAIRLAHDNGFKCMVSHRSGETEDDFIADLCIGASTDFIKSGSPRGERLIKYNKILKIYNDKILKINNET